MLSSKEEILLSCNVNYALRLVPLNLLGRFIRTLLSLLFALRSLYGLPLLEYRFVAGQLRITKRRILFDSFPGQVDDLSFCLLFPVIVSCRYVPNLLGLSGHLILETPTREERFLISFGTELAGYITEQANALTDSEKVEIIEDYLNGFGLNKRVLDSDLKSALAEEISVLQSNPDLARLEKRFIRKNFLDIASMLGNIQMRT
jgi:hypothetical protein